MNQEILAIDQLKAGYGGATVLRDVSVTMSHREIVGLIGPNGAGKTTTLKAISGLVNPDSGELTYQGVSLLKMSPLQRRLNGISYVPQERNVFPNLTVLENFETAFGIAGRHKVSHGLFKERLEFLYELFPRLAERQSQAAGSMSGGEQRMVAIGIGLILPPQVLLLDEPTTGLAPHMVKSLMKTIHSLCKDQNISILIIEQNIMSMVDIVDRLYVMKDGVSREYDGDPRSIGQKNIWEYL
ncbi:MAG: ABC transporter ATP-binding protein [Pusillimonas sp.]|jgi:branched-chain amino acid transport system ATP-binding protein|nr:ABC transporter ATP-binding protein [Pusillimonas sp.]|tara:strand:+ start:2689 stop:3411 length:723 start_codon:yes stop_codon:yes gene_type:complete